MCNALYLQGFAGVAGEVAVSVVQILHSWLAALHLLHYMYTSPGGWSSSLVAQVVSWNYARPEKGNP
jgi:hypothetical protein